MTRGSVAKRERERKAIFPGAYCPAEGCLWSVTSGPCPKHFPDAAREHRNAVRREREQVMRDLGLKKVRGNLGGTYWE